MIYLGTSGYYFYDWIGEVYPSNIKKKDMFDAYIALGFNALELNFTYYKIATALQLRVFSEKAPSGFKYIVKAYQDITHKRTKDDPAKICAENYLNGNVKNNFAGMLLQFPESFHKSDKNIDYIIKMKNVLAGIPLFLEFRGNDWNTEDIYSILKLNGMNNVTVDLPPLESLSRRIFAEGFDTSYIRFHGRNGDWYNAKDRYDYFYNDDELNVFSEEIKSAVRQSSNAFVFFNNCHGGFAVKNALKLKEILKAGGID